MPAHVIVWDLQTVPDLRGFAAANDLPRGDGRQIFQAHLPLDCLHRHANRRRRETRSHPLCLRLSWGRKSGRERPSGPPASYNNGLKLELPGCRVLRHVNAQERKQIRNFLCFQEQGGDADLG